MSLTNQGRPLREACPQLSITVATGLADQESIQLQQPISKLRDNMNRVMAD